METVAEKYDGNDPIRPEGYLYRAARKAGRIGGHLSLVLTDSVKLASDCVTYVQDAYRRAKTSIGRDTRDKGGITVEKLVRNPESIEDADKREFFLNLGRDIVVYTQSDKKGENLTIIDLSKYES